MDLLKLNSDFQNFQKKLEDNEKIIKNITNYTKSLEKDIIKLSQKNEKEQDIILKTINNLIIEIKKQSKSSIEEIMLSK